MSMLAEPRRKVRYNINPNGNMWANDSNAFGKKMLEKMGWSNGKGLGANLDGMTSHVKVHYKCDQGGVGFKNHNDQWTAHEDNFTQLLKNLQENGHQVMEANENDNEEKVETKSLELKSKASRARVHYQKFTRGKDLSQYSNKDLANIFGRKTLEKHVKKPSDEETVSEESNENNDKLKTFGVDTLHGGSMTDYFKKKMSQFKTSLASKTNKKDDDDDNSADEMRPTFGLGFSKSKNSESTQDLELNFVSASDANKIDEEKPKRHKRKDFEDGGDDRTASRKKSKKNVSNDDGLSNEAFDAQSVQDTNGSISHDNPYEVKVKESKENKRDKLLKETAVTNGENCQEGLLNIVLKKRKIKIGIENPSFVTPAENTEANSEVVVNLYEVVSNEKKNKKKKKRKDKDGMENPTFNDTNDQSINEPVQEETPVNSYEVVVKDKTKKRKKTVEVETELSINLGITEDLILNVSNFDPKPILQTPQSADARSKRRKSVRIDESLNQERIIPNVLQQKQFELSAMNACDVEIRMPNGGVANEAFDIKSADSGFYEKHLEYDSTAGYTPMKKKKQRKANIGIANPAFRNVQEEVEDVHRCLETYQAEVENDINEVKRQLTETDDNGDNSVESKFIGTASTLADHQVSPKGTLILAYIHSNLTQVVNRYESKKTAMAKKSYKHLVKGDVEVEFKGTNMHEIDGYATTEALVKKKKKASDLSKENVVPIPKTHLTDMVMLESLTRKQVRKQLKLQKKIEQTD